MDEFIYTLLGSAIAEIVVSYVSDRIKNRKKKKNLDQDKPDSSDSPGDNNR